MVLGEDEMDNPIKQIEELAKTARKEDAPDVNVSGKVMASIHTARPVLEDTSSLNWVVAFSAAAALIAIAALVPFYTNYSDPLLAMMFDLSWSLI